MHPAGHSFGRQVALDLALLIPDRIATVTLICSRDTPFPGFAAAAASLRRAARLTSMPRSAAGSPHRNDRPTARSCATRGSACAMLTVSPGRHT
jgi:3-oxoadipate enol-lactonase